MEFRLIFAAAVLFGACMTSGVSDAQTIAYAAPGTTNLRAGPGTQYTIIARVRGGSVVDVHGCLNDHSWCSISAGPYDGWMAAWRLVFPYAGRNVFVPDYYDHFRAPIIRFHDCRKYGDCCKFRRPPPTDPVTPKCPFPDPRECQPLKGGEKPAPGGWGPDYPPNYRPDGSAGNGESAVIGKKVIPQGKVVCPEDNVNCN